MTTPAEKIAAVCESDWEYNKSDCSGFVRAVAGHLGIALHGQANTIIDFVSRTWIPLENGIAAAASAEQGNFVIGGLKETPHGHVVVVVTGRLGRGKYPTAYWGQLKGVGRKQTSIVWAWKAGDRDEVSYYRSPKAISTGA